MLSTDGGNHFIIISALVFMTRQNSENGKTTTSIVENVQVTHEFWKVIGNEIGNEIDNGITIGRNRRQHLWKEKGMARGFMTIPLLTV